MNQQNQGINDHSNTKRLTTVKERLKYFISLKGISQREFMQQAQVAPNFLSVMNDNLGGNHIRKIISVFPDLNINWLLVGEDYEMTINNPSQRALQEQIEILEMQNKIQAGTLEYLENILKELLNK